MELRARTVVRQATGRSFLALLGIGAVLTAISVVVASQGSANSVEKATDVGILFASKDRAVTYADFAPELSREEALGIARKELESSFSSSAIADVVTRASVALYTGRDETADDHVSDREAWAVVFDDVEAAASGGGPGKGLRPGDAQFNVIVDAHSGDVLFSVLSGRLLPVDE
ncbi:MAG: hypothetical protein WD333_10110 [Dehalococcoidia bacterium]